MDEQQLAAHCVEVLKANDRGTHTVPSPHLYPHQWLWDSCFIAIGLRHIDVKRAQAEIQSLLTGQWSNGMIPHMIFARGRKYSADRRAWFSQTSPQSPDHVATSGITQPPVIVQAVHSVGQKLPLIERRSWYKMLWPQLLAYHHWLYTERDPHEEGLVLQIHPYETGLDNTPPWTAQLREHHRPWWIGVIDFMHLEPIINRIRRDTRTISHKQRSSNLEALLYADVVRRLKRKHYEIDKILHRSLFCIEDLTFNCLLIRSNKLLEEIAKDIGTEIPGDLHMRMIRTESTLDKLWDPTRNSYFSRDFITHNLLPEQSIAAFMPLYSGIISRERADQLVKQLTDTSSFWLPFPVPSVPKDDPYFNQERYWQGPTWINTNWLIIDGLRRYGYNKEADLLIDKSLAMVADHGSYEYFNPITGQALGSPDFSWTAALTIDLLHLT